MKPHLDPRKMQQLHDPERVWYFSQLNTIGHWLEITALSWLGLRWFPDLESILETLDVSQEYILDSTPVHCKKQIILVNPPTGMSLRGGKKPEPPRETHIGALRTWTEIQQRQEPKLGIKPETQRRQYYRLHYHVCLQNTKDWKCLRGYKCLGENINRITSIQTWIRI